MNILAITCWTGDKAMMEMTHRMVTGLAESFRIAGVEGFISVHGQGTEERLPAAPSPIRYFYSPKNKGFACGMNKALGYYIVDDAPDAVLCLNNDLEFPNPDWLSILLQEYGGPIVDRVIVPVTNFTACGEQQAEGPVDVDPIDVPSTPAICWLLPWAACKVLFRRSGGIGKLFREDIGMAWGEDGFASAALQRDFDPNPYRIVPRSFVKHLGERTSSQIPAKEKMACYHRSRELIRSVLGD